MRGYPWGYSPSAKNKKSNAFRELNDDYAAAALSTNFRPDVPDRLARAVSALLLRRRDLAGGIACICVVRSAPNQIDTAGYEWLPPT